MSETARAPARPPEVAARPPVPVVEGEGVGPEVVRAARRVVDQAVARAYGGKRAVDWLVLPAGRAGEALPRETVAAIRQHRVALRGPLSGSVAGEQARAQELSRALDLYVAAVRFSRPAVRVLCEASEGAAGASELVPGSMPAQALLSILRRELPVVSAAIRFGTRERVESYLRSTARREPALVETGLALTVVSRPGADRFVEAALAEATAAGRHRLTFAVDPAVAAVAGSTLADAAYRVAFEHHRAVFTWADFMRASVRAGEAGAEESRTAALEQGLYVEHRPLAALVEAAWGSAEGLDVVAGAWSEGMVLVHVLAARSGGLASVAVARENPRTGVVVAETLHGTGAQLAGRDRANPAAAIRAGATVLAKVQFAEAAALVEAALEKVAALGGRTADAPSARTDAPPPLGCAAYADAVIEALTR